jgi:hypothetical protein
MSERVIGVRNGSALIIGQGWTALPEGSVRFGWTFIILPVNGEQDPSFPIPDVANRFRPASTLSRQNDSPVIGEHEIHSIIQLPSRAPLQRVEVRI